PPTPPLFPYTTLFRSAKGIEGQIGRAFAAFPQMERFHPVQKQRFQIDGDGMGAAGDQVFEMKVVSAQRVDRAEEYTGPEIEGRRSEEHTSELQSRENL